MSGTTKTALIAGFTYALLVFMFGLCLGAVRIALVVPRFGETIAVLVEAPIILLASWWICLRCIVHFKVNASVTARALMGLVALITLQAEEIGLAAAAFGRSPVEYWLSLWSLPGMIGLGAQMAFAAFPLAQAGRANASRSPR
jgi:hypothetical protein